MESASVQGEHDTPEDYLRSPAFLRAMRQRVDSLVARIPASPEVGAAWSAGEWERYAASEVPPESQEPESQEPESQEPESREPAVSYPSSHEVVFQEGTLRLLRFAPPPRRRACYREPVLICYSLINRPYILDLSRQRSVIQQLTGRGLTVYLIDWGVPSRADSRLRISDYICGRLRQVAALVRRHAGCENFTLLGYCMGGTMATMYAALYPREVRNLVLLAAPIDFDDPPCLLNLWAREEYFDVDALVDKFGNCPGTFLQTCFQAMTPVSSTIRKYVDIVENRENRAFLENFFAIERWSHDSIPVAGETFREFVKQLYRENRLVAGTLSLDDGPVRLASIDCPVLMLVARKDRLVSPASTLALASHVSSRDVERLQIDAGHIGLAIGTGAHRFLWPAASRWLAARATPAARD